MKLQKQSNTAQKRILIVEDHPMTRLGICTWICNEPDLNICAEVASAEQAIKTVSKKEPDLVLTDLTLPGKNGIELIKDIQALNPNLPVLVISMHQESLYAERAIRAGARGYIMKGEDGEQMLKAIRCVLKGKIYLSEQMSERILEQLNRKKFSLRGMKELSDREFEVFELIGHGCSTLAIANQLGVSVKTVDTHRARIKAKLKIKSLPKLISYASQWVAHETTDTTKEIRLI